MKRRRKGVLLALVGPDGCGKTTTTGLLLEKLREAGIDGSTAYLGPWGKILLPSTRLLYRLGLVPEVIPWMSFLSHRIRGSGSGENENPEVPGAEHSLAKIVWKAFKAQVRGGIYYPFLYLELMARYWKFVRPGLRRGGVVIAERYAFDLRYIHDTVEVENYPKLRKWVCDCFPSPDLTILLDNDPEKIHARKPQLSIEALRWQRESYRRVLNEVPHLILRTDEDASEISAQILERVQELLAE